MTRAIIIPADGPLREIDLERRGDGHLAHLQQLVDGNIEALPMTPAVRDATACDRSTLYINEDGKYLDGCTPNMRATDFMVPGIGISYGDCIAGTMIIVGFNPDIGEHTDSIPAPVTARARLIAEESGAGWQEAPR